MQLLIILQEIIGKMKSDRNAMIEKILYLEGKIRVICRVRPILGNELNKRAITYTLTDNNT